MAPPLSSKSVFPDLFATLAVPKAEELVATPYRHGNKEKAETFFLAGMSRGDAPSLPNRAHPGFPVTIYYAFKQSERKGDEAETSSTGWETFLDAVIRGRFLGHRHVADAHRATRQSTDARMGTRTPSPPASSWSAASALRTPRLATRREFVDRPSSLNCQWP